MTPDVSRFIQRTLGLYRKLAGEHVRPRPADRQLAQRLHEQGVGLDLLEAALRLAMARRSLRPPEAPALQPVRSLHYFLPVIDELRHLEGIDEYLDYLRRKDPSCQRHRTGDCPNSFTSS